MKLGAALTPFGAVIIPIIVVLFIAALIYSRKRRNKLIDEGKMIQRENKFWDKSETFTVNGVTLAEIFEKLPANDLKQNVGQYELQSDKNRIVFVHNGYEESYTGTLTLIAANDGANTYRLLINQYKTKHTNPNELSLNVLYTSVEKVFLGIDPNIQVKTDYVDRKVTHSLF